MNKSLVFRFVVAILLLLDAGVVRAQKVYSTNHDYQADVKVYFVDHEYQADLKIYFVNNEYQAGWRDKSKIHLLYGNKN